jgi:hypothetical protein
MSKSEQNRSWSQTAAKAFKQPAQPTHDVALGRGAHVPLAPEALVPAIDLYPEAGALRVKTLGNELTVFGVSTSTAGAEGIVFEASRGGEETRLTLSPDGAVTLAITMRPAARKDPDQAAAPLSPAPRESATHEAPEKERVTFAGRLGTDPRFRTTPKGTLVAELLVGVHEDDETTIWKKVVAFDERARKLEGTVSRGQLV